LNPLPTTYYPEPFLPVCKRFIKNILRQSFKNNIDSSIQMPTHQKRCACVIVIKTERLFKILQRIFGIVKTHIHGNCEPVLGRGTIGSCSDWREIKLGNFPFKNQIAAVCNQIQTGLVQKQILKFLRKIPSNSGLNLSRVVLEKINLDGFGRIVIYIGSCKRIGNRPTTLQKAYENYCEKKI